MSSINLRLVRKRIADRRGPAGPVVIRRLWHYARHGQPVPDFFTVTCPCGRVWRR